MLENLTAADSGTKGACHISLSGKSREFEIPEKENDERYGMT
jgi:hypothetical protein